MKACQYRTWIAAAALLLSLAVHDRTMAAEQPESDGNTVIPLEVPATLSLRAVPAAKESDGETGRIYFQRPKVGLGLAYHFEEEERRGGRGDSRDTTQEWRERLVLETNGWIYHPALMKLKLRVEPELRQSTQDRDSGENDDSSDTLASYFAEARLLDPKPVSLRLFGQRRETTLRSAFAQSAESEIDTYGADIYLKNRLLPTTLGYVHRDVDQSGFFDSQETQDQYNLVTHHNAIRSKTRLSATYSENERTLQGFTNTVDTLNSDLHNEWMLARDQRVKLNSFWNYRSSDFGTLETNSLRLRENLHWQHRTNLRSDYNLGFSRAETGVSEFQSQDAEARVTHLYNDRLTTAGGAGYTGNEFTGGDEQIYRGRLDFTFRQPIEWGRMNLFAGANYDVTTRNLDALQIQVIAEPQTLSTSAVTFLNNPNVDPATVRVTNGNATIVYVNGADYILEQIGNQTRISRTVLGNIAEGQTVLVDYQFTSDASFDDAILRQRYGFEFFLWDALTLSYRYRRADQSITSGPDPSSPAGEQVHTALVRYTKPMYETRLTLEDSERDSGISTTQWSAEQTLRQHTGGRLFGSITGGYTDIYFKELDQSEQVISLRVRGEYLLRSWSKFSLEGFWESVSGDLREVVDTGILAKLEFKYRIWTGGITYSYLDEHDEANDDRRTRQTVQVELIRIPF